MPVKSSKTASTTTPRKRRTRKTTTTRTAKTVATPTAKKPAVKKVTVTTFKSGKAVSKVTTLKRPSTARLISPQKYLKDIETRWAIHNYEIQELIRDFTKGFEAVKPYHAQLVELVTK